MSVLPRRRRPSRLSWGQLSLLVGGVLTVLWMAVDPAGLDDRVVIDGTLFVVGPLAVGTFYGRNLGLRVDRRVLTHTAGLAALVLPFYFVGSVLPTIRAYYPMWETAAGLGQFLPHSIKQLVVVIAAETYYRGLLCVGVSEEFGPKSVLISPVVYALHHSAKPPVEFLLSGPTDVLFGAVDYRSGSILPSVVAHGLGLALLDWLVLHPPILPQEPVVRSLQWLPIAL